jgi:hypothetical protein
MAKSKTLILIFCALFSMASYATTVENINLPSYFWQIKPHVTIVITQPSVPKLYSFGPGTHPSRDYDFSDYVKKLDMSWYYALPSNFSKRLKEKNINANYSYNRKAKNRDMTLLIQLMALGAIKDNYDSFFDSYKAHVVLRGELIDSHHQVVWRHTASITKPVYEKWDQSSYYSTFNSELNLAVNTAKEMLLDSFFSGT